MTGANDTVAALPQGSIVTKTMQTGAKVGGG